jgi:two-component system, cell cycle sensor histidine kinase and response regulator CckA
MCSSLKRHRSFFPNFQLSSTHQSSIDLLVFDVMLPNRSGPEAYSEILKIRSHIPVIFATGYSSDIALLHKTETMGAVLLQKPYVPRDLARRVRELLDQHVSKLNPV